jgi:hypothetical protein
MTISEIGRGFEINLTNVEDIGVWFFCEHLLFYGRIKLYYTNWGYVENKGKYLFWNGGNPLQSAGQRGTSNIFPKHVFLKLSQFTTHQY